MIFTNLLPHKSSELKNAVVVTLATVSIIAEIIYHTRCKSIAQKQCVFDMVDKDHLHHLQEVYNFMNNTIRECNRNKIKLTSIEHDLLIASKNKSFSQVNVMSIRANCRRILKTFQSLLKDSKRRKKQARKVLRDISIMRADIEKRRRKNTLANITISLLGGSIFGHVFGTADGTTESALLSGLNVAGPALVGAGFVELSRFCASYDYEVLSVILDNLLDYMSYLINCLSKLIENINDVIPFLKNYVLSADENITDSSQSSENVLIQQAAKMITETNQLQNKLNQMILMAERKAYCINNTIYVEY